jgi:uncharacterized protein YlzI (FlbEa/FlbD family)
VAKVYEHEGMVFIEHENMTYVSNESIEEVESKLQEYITKIEKIRSEL